MSILADGPRAYGLGLGPRPGCNRGSGLYAGGSWYSVYPLLRLPAWREENVSLVIKAQQLLSTVFHIKWNDKSNDFINLCTNTNLFFVFSLIVVDINSQIYYIENILHRY